MENQFNTGAIFSQKDARDYMAICASSEVEFPEEFSLKLSNVKNQGKINSCVAHSLSTVVEYFNKKQNNVDDIMSTGYIYGNRTTSVYKNEGMIIRDALNALTKYGDVPYICFPYNVEVPEAIDKFEENLERLYENGYSHRISSYYKLTTENDIKKALMCNGPVIAAMEWYSDMTVEDGLLTTALYERDSIGGHCIVIYGWDHRGWKIQNSWGNDWGDNGCAVVPYDMEIREKWAVTDDIIEGMDIVKPYSSPIGQIIALILNLIYKLLNL